MSARPESPRGELGAADKYLPRAVSIIWFEEQLAQSHLI